MKINPIIPIWLMAVICIVLLVIKRKGIATYIRQIMIVVLLFVINLRIMIPNGNTTAIKQDLNARVIFVLDNTVSMLAVDSAEYDNRLEAVKSDCKYITEKLNGASFSVISFDNNANLKSPFTKDTAFIQDVIECIEPLDPHYGKGTSMNVAKDLLVENLTMAAEKDDGEIVVFFISDGEITNGDELDSFKDASKYIDNGAVLGYGTTQGAVMRYLPSYADEGAELETVRKSDYTGDAISRIDEKNLQKIADDLSIDYIHMTSQKDIDSKLENVKKNLDKSGESRGAKGYMDIYYFFVIPLALLLMYEFVKGSRKDEQFS